MKNKIYLLLIATITSFFSLAQEQSKIDSLTSQLKILQVEKVKQRHNVLSIKDTNIANVLIALASEYDGYEPNTSLDFAHQAKLISEKIAFKKGMNKSYNTIANAYFDKGKMDSALIYHEKALKIRKELGDKRGIAGSSHNIGNVLSNKGNLPMALKYFYTALKINEEIGNKKWQIFNLESIAGIYFYQSQYTEALKLFRDALKIATEIGNREKISSLLYNIGTLYNEQGMRDEALKYNLASLKEAEEIGNKNQVSYCYLNLSAIYKNQNKLKEAIEYGLKALAIVEELGIRSAVPGIYLNIGEAYVLDRKFKEAQNYLNKSMIVAKEVNSLEQLGKAYLALSELDSIQGNHYKALFYYKLYVSAKDSLKNDENTKKTVQLQMQYDFDKKQAIAKAQQEKKDAIALSEQARSKQQKTILFLGLVIAISFAAWDYRQKKIISKQKQRSEELLLNILPAEVAEELKAKGSADAQLIDEVTVLFTDFKGFTQLSEKLSPKELVAEINECFSAFDYIMVKHGVEKIKTIGDAYMAAGGLPTANTTHAEDVVNAALAIQTFMQEHKAKKLAANELFFEIRIGVHTGPVVAGIVGVKKFAYDIWGDTVNTASRMESSGEVGKVNISGTTYALLKDKFNCVHRGKVQAKGKGEIDMYFVEG